MRNFNFVKRNTVTAILMAAVVLTSCEMTDINLGEENIFTRLEAFIGQDKQEVTRQMRKEGYRVVNMFENTTNFLEGNGNNQYAILFNAGNKTIYGSSYYSTAHILDSAAFIENEAKYAEWRIGASEKNCENYQGTISGTTIVDFDSLFVRKTTVNDSVTSYFYDNEDYFNIVYSANRDNLQSASEVWYNGNPGTAEEYMIEYTNDDIENGISISVSDGSLRE